MVKEIRIISKCGDIDPETAKTRGHVSFKMGRAEAEKAVAELNGRFGDDFSDKPVLVLRYDSEEAAEAGKNHIENFDVAELEEGDVSPEELERHREEFKDLIENKIKLKVTRIGAEVLVSRTGPVEEMQEFTGIGAAAVGDVASTFSAKIAYNRSLKEITDAQRHPFYNMFVGSYAELDVDLDDDMAGKIANGIGMGDALPGKAGKIAFKFFKRLTFKVESDDIEHAPDAIKQTSDSEWISAKLDFWGKVSEALAQIPEHILSNFRNLRHVTGPIDLYFPVNGIGVLHIDAFSEDFIGSFFDFVQSCKDARANASG